MTIALAAIAILVSAGVAVVQFVQGRRQSDVDAQIQDRLAVVEEARRRDELTPKLVLRYISEPGDVDGSLEWVNEGPQDLDNVSFMLIERSGAGWLPLRGVRFRREGWTLTEGSLGAIGIGEPVVHGIVRNPGSESDGGIARFRMRCTKGDESWDVALECKIPRVES